MADILPFKATAKAKPKNLKGNSLCRQGHHKWKIVTGQKFDVKQGKLITASECIRCGKRKNKAI